MSKFANKIPLPTTPKTGADFTVTADETHIWFRPNTNDAKQFLAEKYDWQDGPIPRDFEHAGSFTEFLLKAGFTLE